MGGAVRANTVFILCIFLYVFRELGDADPKVETLAVILKSRGGSRESTTTNLKSTKKTLHGHLRMEGFKNFSVSARWSRAERKKKTLKIK